jgi:hypothetical protein
MGKLSRLRRSALDRRSSGARWRLHHGNQWTATGRNSSRESGGHLGATGTRGEERHRASGGENRISLGQGKRGRRNRKNKMKNWRRTWKSNKWGMLGGDSNQNRKPARSAHEKITGRTSEHWVGQRKITNNAGRSSPVVQWLHQGENPQAVN